jgi:hypothetical protein
MEQLQGDDLGDNMNVETQGEMSDYYNSLKGDRVAEMQKKLDAANEEISTYIDNLQEMLDEADPNNPNQKKYGKTWAIEQSHGAAQDLRDAAERIRNTNNPNVDKSLADDLDNAADQVMSRIENNTNPLIFASVGDANDIGFNLGEVDADLDQMRELYFETDTDEIKKYLDQTGVYGDVRSGGAEAVVSDTPEEDGEHQGKYRASVSYGGGTSDDDQVEYFDDPEDAKDWAANEVSNLSSYHQVGLTHPDKSFSDLDAERDAAIANGTEQEFLSRLSDVAKMMRDQRGDEKLSHELNDYVDRAQVALDKKKGNSGGQGFAQEPGNAVVSPKMGESASEAQYDYLKELSENRDGVDPDLATAIQDALQGKNLTKAQMGAMLGQLRALNPKAGVDLGKPTPRQIQRVKDLANSLGLSPAEKRKLGISKVSSMSADEVQKLIDNLKRRGANSPKA